MKVPVLLPLAAFQVVDTTQNIAVQTDAYHAVRRFDEKETALNENLLKKVKALEETGVSTVARGDGVVRVAVRREGSFYCRVVQRIVELLLEAFVQIV